MLNLSKYPYEDSDMLRRTDGQFDKVWGQMMRARVGTLLPYSNDHCDTIAVPHLLTLTYTEKSLTGVRLDRVPHDMPHGSGIIFLRPFWEQEFERQEVRAEIYSRHILNCVERSHGRRPLFLAENSDLLDATDPDIDPGDYHDQAAAGAVIRAGVLRRLAQEELDARHGESNHVKMERLRRQKEAA